MTELLSAKSQSDEALFEQSLRPRNLDEYIGQQAIKDNLKIFIQAASQRHEALDHVLLFGPPGLGKTTLANIIAHSLEVPIKTSSGPAIEKPIDLLILLKGLPERSVLFIDEIHRLSRVVEEILYPCMEDFCFDKVMSKATSLRNTKVKLPAFTLVGATTRSGSISSPLRDRFGIIFNLNFYTSEELQQIVLRSAQILGIAITPDAALELAGRCRGTPRIANRLLKRVRDFAQVLGAGAINLEVTNTALERLGIDAIGLDIMDRRILETLIFKFKGAPVGIETLSASLNEEPQNIEEVYEPYLLQIGMINKTPRGRVAAPLAYQHFNITPDPLQLKF